jgi:hypothetical protein
VDQIESDSIKPKKPKGNVGMNKVRPHPGPLPPEREKGLPRPGKIGAVGSRMQGAKVSGEALPATDQTQSNLIKPKNPTGGTPGPRLTPEEVAYNAWFRMHIRAVPFDYELLHKLYANIPKKKTADR